MSVKKVRKNARNVLIFSKWSRKQYAVFLTMRREVIISVLAVSYLISIPVKSISSVPDTTEIKQQYNLDEIEISAQRAPVLYSQVARVVSVIPREEIEYAPVSSVQDLLEYVAGVDVRQRGAEGVQGDVSIRGGTFDQTLILLNGINITDPQTGHHNLDLPVSLNQIERIEILEGPSARIYGPNAFSGAINIITRQPDRTSLEVGIEGGSYNYLNVDGLASFATKKMDHAISVARNSSKGYIDNTDFTLSDIFYSGKINLNTGNLNYQIGLGSKDFGANSFYTPKYPNQFEETKTLFSSIKWQSNTRLHFTPVVYWRNHRDKFELFRNNAPEWYTTHNYHLTNTYGTNINSWVQWAAGKSAFGVEYRSENILSNVLGKNLAHPRPVPGENAQFTKSDSRNTMSVFLEHTVLYPNFSATAGVMGNYIFDSGLGINMFPGIDIGYQLISGLKIFTSFNTSLRMPTFTDLYYKGPTNLGNPELKPERSATLEGGLKWNLPVFLGNMVIFYRNGTNIIDWVKMEQDELWQPQNLTHIISYGTEIDLKINMERWLGRGLPKQITLNYFFNNLEKGQTNFISNYVLDNVKHKFVCSVNQQIFNNLIFSGDVIFQDRAGTFTVFENGNYGQEKNYPPFWIFDARLNYSVKNIKFYVSVNNIFNKVYYDLANIPQPGRWVKAGISYRFRVD